ncbi:MAG: hypothetical protein H0W25_02380 [Acidimicrobiia bacterium]|nr:hypothetical protein [Acidimicrobiia bacterium]
MTIGVGILIATVGAILRFAVTADADGVDIQMIGTILIITGLAIAFIALVFTMSRRRTVTTAAAGYRRGVVASTPVVQSTPVVAAPVVQQPVVAQPVVQNPAPAQGIVVNDPGGSAQT